MQKRCANCFEILNSRAKKCSACGVLLSSVKNEEHLRVGTVLANRYYVGRTYKNEPATTVYLSFDEQINSKVFIREFSADKFISQTYTEKTIPPRERLLERFSNYCKSMAKLSLCRLMPRTLDVFVENDNAYAVYEFFEGESLQSLLDANVNISTKSAVKITNQLCNGLAVLHGAHTIYGALSPETLYISSSGAVYLFGISSPFYDFIDDVDRLAELLSPSFAAPELFLKGLKCGTYSDVYSVAAVLYRILCGEEPPIGFLRSQGDTVLAPNKINASVDKSVSVAILNALNWHLSVRTQSLNAFMRELMAPRVARRLSFMVMFSCLLAKANALCNKIKAFCLNKTESLRVNKT